MAFNLRIYGEQGFLLFNMHSELIEAALDLQQDMNFGTTVPVKIEIEKAEALPCIVDGDDI